MNKASGYSLWLVPPRGGPEYDLLRGIIHTLSMKHQTPMFDPHVTLLGGIEGEARDLSEKTERLASSLYTYPIWFDEIQTGRTFFQRLFCTVVEARTLLRAHYKARRTFGVGGGRYQPHLSLMYADPTSQELSTTLEMLPQHKLQELYIAPRCVELWRTQGVVGEWELVGSFSMRTA